MSRKIFFFLLLITTCVFQLSSQSNLVLSSRWFHPRYNKDTMSTLEAIKRFKPSRIEWTYATDSATTQIYHRLNIPFSLTTSPMAPDSVGHTSKKMRIQTIKGETYVAPWMKEWKIKTPYWGCVNNPEFVALFYQHALKLNALGPYALMVDDPEFNTRLKTDKIVGCFCEHCTKKFVATYRKHAKNKKILLKKMNKFMLSAEVVKKPTVPPGKQKKNELVLAYEQFQEKSVEDFLLNWKKEMLKVNPKLKFLCNNFNGRWESYHRVFDGGVCELNENLINEKDLDKLYKKADELGKTQLFNSNSKDPAKHEFLLRYALSHKREVLIPWDVFIKDSPTRYYINYNKFDEIYREYKN